MNATLRSAATISIYLILADAAPAATVTMTRTPNVVRPQTQGAGTYDVYDFFFTMAPGAEFSNYRVIANLTTGSIADPAREQDNRQFNSTNETNTAGSVDLYFNTVWSYAAKETHGYSASLVTSAGSYFPTGGGAAPLVPPIQYFDWGISDTLTEDDNDLSDALTNGPVNIVAPYHLLRVLTTPGATGTVQILSFDTSQPGVPFDFDFLIVPEPSSFLVFVQAVLITCGRMRRRR